MYGSFLNFVEFDSVRYWDIRDDLSNPFIYLPKQLPSSSIYRKDRILLEKGLKTDNVDVAQEAKEELENIQRNDRKLRKKYGPEKK